MGGSGGSGECNLIWELFSSCRMKGSLDPGQQEDVTLGNTSVQFLPGSVTSWNKDQTGCLFTSSPSTWSGGGDQGENRQGCCRQVCAKDSWNVVHQPCSTRTGQFKEEWTAELVPKQRCRISINQVQQIQDNYFRNSPNSVMFSFVFKGCWKILPHSLSFPPTTCKELPKSSTLSYQKLNFMMSVKHKIARK